jgi:hypothetical protein
VLRNACSNHDDPTADLSELEEVPASMERIYKHLDAQQKGIHNLSTTITNDYAWLCSAPQPSRGGGRAY